MPLPEIMLAVLWLGLSAYVLFAGADFGGGVWDLLVGGADRGRAQRTLVEHSVVPPGIARGHPIASWLNPTSVLAGVLAVGVAVYLAAVYLTRDAERGGRHDLALAFRRRALFTGAVVGALSVAGLVVLDAGHGCSPSSPPDAPSRCWWSRSWRE